MPGSAWSYLNGETLLTAARLPGLRIRPVWVYEQCLVRVAPEQRGGCNARHGPGRHRAGLQDAKAANTRRAYEAAWQRFHEWTDAVGHRSLPAAPQVVALHLGRLAATGRAQATIELARAAISHAHAAAGIAKADNPARAPTAAVQNQGRWKDGDMVARYTRGEAAGEALKWLS